jgi:hypothetical protein
MSIIGSSSTINTTNLVVGDAIIVLAHSQSTPSVDSGIFVDRGSGATQAFYWNENTDEWTFASTTTNHETGGPVNVITYSNIKASGIDVSQIKITNGAQNNYILISDAQGNASWTASVPGTSGTSGSSGTSGTSGTSGSAGTSGTSGTSGTRGTSGTSGTSGQQGESAGIRYNFDALSTASTDPGIGLFRFNNAAASGTTEIYIDDLDVNSVNFANYITSWDNSTSNVKGVIEIKSNSNSDTTICNFQLTALTDNLGWNILSVIYLSGGTPTDVEQCSITFYRTGDKGDGTSGTSGTRGTSGTSGNTGTSGTSGNTGTSGTSGTRGTSGTSGANGTSGTSGANGTSGTSGGNGTSGTSGANGTSGTAGSAGTSGTSGTGFTTISPTTDNNVLTANGTANSANSEPNLTFNGNTLTVTGTLSVSGRYQFTHQTINELSANGGYGDIVTFGSGTVATFSTYNFNSSSQWVSTDADTSTSTGLIGIAIGGNVSSGILLRGYVRNSSWSWATASALYLSTTASTMTQTAPTATGDYIRIVGYAISTNTIYFCPDNTWILI